MNDVSRAAIRTVEQINERAGRPIAAYTFDAGPNCVIYYLEENEAPVLAGLSVLTGVKGFPGTAQAAAANVDDSKWAQTLKTGIERVISTRVGPGPQELAEHLPAV